MKTITKIVLFSFFTVVLWACVKKDLEDLKVEKWRPEIAMPLIFSGYSAEEVIKQFETDGKLTTENDIITLVYSGEIFKIEAKDLITLPDVAYIFPDTFLDVSLGTKIEGQYHSLALNSGNLNYDIRLDYSKDVLVDLVIPKATKNGQPFVHTIEVPFQGNASMSAKGKIDLSNSTFDLKGEDGESFNIFRMYYVARDKNTGKSVILNNFSGSLNEMRFHLITGKFDDYLFQLNKQSVELDIFENFKEGKVIIHDPKLNLIFVNSFGIPISAQLSSFKGNSNGVKYPLTGRYLDQKIEIDFPDINAANQEVVSNTFIDKENSDIQNLISFTPGSIEYSFDVDINLKKNSSKINFVRDSSFFQGSLDLEIPFNATIDNVLLVDSFSIEMEDLEEAEEVSFKLITENSFPIDIGLQFVFVDELGFPIDSLIPHSRSIFKTGPANSERVVEEALTTTTIFDMNQQRFKRIMGSKKVAMKIRMMSANNGNQNVKFLSTSEIGIKLGVIGQLSQLN